MPTKDPSWVIYGLKSNNSGGIRYVGKTTWKASHRLRQHLSDARRKVSNRRVINWINSVPSSSITQVVLEICPKGDKDYLNYAEKYWISELKSMGHDLVNHTEGGDGSSGYQMTDEARDKLSTSMKGRYLGENNPRYGVKGDLHPMFGIIGPAHPGYGYKPTEEHKNVLRVKATGRTHSAEARKKISDYNKGRPKSEETKQKLRMSQHLIHHVNRGIISERCILCIPTTVSE